MKKIVLIFSVFLLLFSCGSASFQGFYNNHKTDLGATSFQVPNVMKALLSSVSPETKSVIGNLQDVKYIKLNSVSSFRRQQIITEINAVTSAGYLDMFRDNQVNNTRIISVKENGNVLTDVILFNCDEKEATAFYLQGRFDPDKIKTLSEVKNFDALSLDLLQSYKSNMSPSLNPSFNPNN
ncbi:DUF4252 domain-containing protein [Lacinutrix sp. Bg11-31]|uniref:DUF4252 domain-containing protein n=1 Tax=Lacinutrix sp. Bg11-31 TaxID=2057808 RepID=UPI000C3025D0|nr:DUF4252 domain-containing protein [Lacinutrix sp. Bg11-31]AUC82205.1 hypothetical protein CW733_08710 [Lacinutrix sp. Bg11-31]